jgi:hypothetical protein
MKMEETDNYFLLLLFMVLSLCYSILYGILFESNMAYAENMHALVVKEYSTHKFIKRKLQTEK